MHLLLNLKRAHRPQRVRLRQRKRQRGEAGDEVGLNSSRADRS